MSEERLVPTPDADSKPFWEACRDHKLIFQKCATCGEVRWPPSILCPRCHSVETEWIESGERGRIYTYAIYHQAFHPSFKGQLPYVVGVVELDEGPMMLTNIVGSEIGALECEMAVEVVWEDLAEGVSLPKFRVVGGVGGEK